jgi:NADP-dependent 3-hydroxy acid dehydrogenase YdfG
MDKHRSGKGMRGVNNLHLRMKLDGRLMMRWVLVTGPGGGIREGIARVLAADGWMVAVNDLDSAGAERLQRRAS